MPLGLPITGAVPHHSARIVGTPECRFAFPDCGEDTPAQEQLTLGRWFPYLHEWACVENGEERLHLKRLRLFSQFCQ